MHSRRIRLGAEPVRAALAAGRPSAESLVEGCINHGFDAAESWMAGDAAGEGLASIATGEPLAIGEATGEASELVAVAAGLGAVVAVAAGSEVGVTDGRGVDDTVGVGIDSEVGDGSGVEVLSRAAGTS